MRIRWSSILGQALLIGSLCFAATMFIRPPMASGWAAPITGIVTGIFMGVCAYRAQRSEINRQRQIVESIDEKYGTGD